ncbi:EF-hand domain-containing protein [Flocculibacter collagenilyticus]|uniref:hypothetical protein n=1 Tax=Flocculibacter collagenilyticus TaxID=2744479 RepID=UPI0018F5F1B0|nr:hypothetical protein [Flocculibacter collagenilyticus]
MFKKLSFDSATASLVVGAAFVIMGTTLLVSTPAHAKAGGHGGPGKGGMHKFMKVDTNQDGMLDLTEMTTAAQLKAEKKLERVDADDNGSVSFEEYTATRRGGADLTEYAEDIIQCVTDLKEELGSTTIQIPSVDDFKTPQARFDSKDTNSDGMIDLSEAQAAATAKATEKFEKLDADEDELVTKTEIRDHHQQFKGTKRAMKHCIKETLNDNIMSDGL